MPIPTVGKAIAIIFGASSFPSYPTLDPSPAFRESAENFEKYLTSYHGLRIPPDNVKWVFDTDLHAWTLLSEMRKFVKEKLKASSDVTDIIFYYCGHGGYLNGDEYFLALQSTDRESKEATVFRIRFLRDMVADLTKDKRNLIVLDASYSGAALGEFVHLSDDENAADLVTSQISGLSRSQDHMAPESTEAMASEGIVLFCAAGAKKWAKTPLEARYTMFTGALLKVLEDGDQKVGPFFTLKQVAELVHRQINSTFGSEGVQPQIHVPVQGVHNFLQSPYFPNPAFVYNAEGRVSQTSLTDKASVVASQSHFSTFDVKSEGPLRSDGSRPQSHLADLQSGLGLPKRHNPSMEMPDTDPANRRLSRQRQTPEVGPKRDKIFISYSHRDKKVVDEFKIMLAPAVRNRSIDLWDDTKVEPGSKWKEEIEAALREAKVAVLLVSRYFLASDFIAKHELPPLLASAHEDGVTIFWVYLSDCLYRESQIVNYQAAHDVSRPLSSLSSPQRLAVLTKICERLIQIVKGSTGVYP